MDLSKILACLAVSVFTLTVVAGEEVSNHTFRVSLVQLHSSNAGNYEEMLDAARRAKKAGAELVVFPNHRPFGWLNPKVFTEAQPIPGSISEQFSSIAMKADIWLPPVLRKKAWT